MLDKAWKVGLWFV